MAASDKQLIKRALNGSVEAWDTLVRRHQSRVYNFCLRLTGDAEDALDLMQEVFLGVYRSLPGFRGDSQFSSWLFRIAHNKAIDLVRRQQARPSVDSFSGESREPVSEMPGPDEQMQQSQGNARILYLLGQLSDEQRRIVELKIYQGMTFDEIAGLERISSNTAKTRFYTALRKLKHAMERDHEL